MKILFLYTEIASYFTACVDELSKETEVHVLRYPINKEAPFQFSTGTKIIYYERNDYTYDKLRKLIEKINPDAIFCSGWIDKDYLKICKFYKNKIPTVLCMDTKWKGNFKQIFASILAPFIITNKFSHAWVPGNIQQEFALRLGIKKENIRQGYYCADTNFFINCYNNNKEQKNKKFPKRLIYVGRYYEFKGITDLWTAFVELQIESPNEWELWCLGTGDLKPIEHPKIKHIGFVQTADLTGYIENTGVFVLPSRFEPWAVVVHEFAAAGFPLLLSSEVGAKELFLEENVNGHQFEANNIEDLKENLKKFFTYSDERLNLMSKHSNELSRQLTIDKWCNIAREIIKQ